MASAESTDANVSDAAKPQSESAVPSSKKSIDNSSSSAESTTEKISENKDTEKKSKSDAPTVKEKKSGGADDDKAAPPKALTELERRRIQETRQKFNLVAVAIVVVSSLVVWYLASSSASAAWIQLPDPVMKHLEKGTYVPVHTKKGSYQLFVGGEGRKRAEVVVLVAEPPFSSYTWRSVIPKLLASNAYRVVTFDFPGVGLSDKSDSLEYTTAALAESVRDAIDGVQVSTGVHLVLHGSSALPGLLFAAENPLSVKSITLVAPILNYENFELPFLLEQALVKHTSLATNKLAFLTWQLLQNTLSSSLSRDDAMAHFYLMNFKQGLPALARIAAGVDRSIALHEQITKGLAKCNASLQVIWASSDKLVSPPDHRAVLERIAGKRKVQSHTAVGGHLLPEDSPLEIAELVQQLVNTVAPPAAQPSVEDEGPRVIYAGDLGHGGHAGHDHSHGHGGGGHAHHHGHDHAHEHHGHGHGHGHAHGHDHGQKKARHGHHHGHGHAHPHGHDHHGHDHHGHDHHGHDHHGHAHHGHEHHGHDHHGHDHPHQH